MDTSGTGTPEAKSEGEKHTEQVEVKKEKCPHCGGTGLADHHLGNAATKLCTPCEGSGTIKL